MAAEPIEPCEITMRTLALEARLTDLEEAHNRLYNLVSSKLSDFPGSKTAEMLEKTLTLLNDGLSNVSESRLPEVELGLKRVQTECGMRGRESGSSDSSVGVDPTAPPPPITLARRVKILEGMVAEILDTLHGFCQDIQSRAASTQRDLREIIQEQEDVFSETYC